MTVSAEQYCTVAAHCLLMAFLLHTRDHVPIESAESIHCSSSSIDSLHELSLPFEID